MKFASQSEYPVRFEWGMEGVVQVANGGGVAIIVDVLSFSTCVDIACARGAQTMVAAGERWEDGTLRPAIEDLIGARAIIQALTAEKSPEATIAEVTFVGVSGQLLEVLEACSSGIELISKGFPGDVNLAAQLNASECVPVLVNGSYISAEG